MYTDTRISTTNTDLDEFLNTIKMPWKTMDSDMDTALGIIANHAKTEFDAKTTQLMTIIPHSGDEVAVEFPDWQSDVEKTFIHQYGLTDGKLIFNKVLMRLFQMSQGTEQQLH